MTKHLVVTCVIAVAWLLAASPVLAAGTGGACKDDVKRLCGGVKRGGGAVSRCLNEHRNQLSKDCAAQRAKGKAKAKAKGAGKVKPWKEACKDDVDKLCDGVKPGEGRVTACLLGHPKKLSADCRATLDHGQARKTSFGKACQYDVARFCADGRAGRRRALKCLREHQYDLSPACKAETGL